MDQLKQLLRNIKRCQEQERKIKAGERRGATECGGS